MPAYEDFRNTGKVFQVVGVYDGLSARIADAEGFDWLHLGGYNLSGSRLALPDTGFLTMTEVAEAASRIAATVGRPLMVDGDDGYGNHLNVMRLVREIERSGASGIHMEDQVFPKKCGHMENKRVVPTESFVNKIKAFVDTRRSSDFLLFARTDALATDGFDAAVERGNRYLEAGADVIFVEAPTTFDQAERLPKLIAGPVMYNWVYGGKSPLIPRETLAALGYRFYLQADVLYPVAHALRRYFATLKRTGAYDGMEGSMLSFDEFNDLIGLAAVVAADERYR